MFRLEKNTGSQNPIPHYAYSFALDLLLNNLITIIDAAAERKII